LLENSRGRTFWGVEESRRERKKRLTRQRIVMAAVELFETGGYEQTTVAQIAAAADVDPKTFFNYFGSKDEVLFSDIDRDYDRLLGAIAAPRPGERPGEVLARAVREFAAHRRAKVPEKEPEELSATMRLVFTTPALQAKALYMLLDLQQRIAGELRKAFPGLDPVTAGAMTGSLIGALLQAGLTSVQLGRSQARLWEANAHALDIALDGLRSVRLPDGKE
jgi:AcrR family transcriptional regulator